jgi:outer membrane protein TolC
VTNASLQALPDLQLTGAINQWLPAGAPNPGVNRDYTLGIGIVVPIFFPFNELQGIHAAQKNRDAAENQFASQQLQATSLLQTAYTSLNAIIKDLDTSERLVVPAAKESFDLTLLTYGLGKADYLIVNQSRQAWHEAMRDMMNKRQNAAQLYNQLIIQLGCDIAKTEGPHACQ